MSLKRPLLVLLTLGLGGGAAVCALATDEAPATQTIIRAGTLPSIQGSAEFFTGSPRIDPLFRSSDAAHYSGAYVTFEPGSRTNWHLHPAGQHIIVTSGVGRTAAWGGPVETIEVGDVVWCPPGVKHWHGAAPDEAMTHLVITGARDGSAVEWLESVTDAQYAGN